MALRKLQAEIDRTLKAVATGVETFESTFEKLGHATNSTQKDKVENDLKTQIKKLQRMRDQIKAWLGSSDIKDKSALLDNRKLIETQMERFKALEKEMKMKAFSKEGLIAQSKLDPAEKAKRDMTDWIGTTTDELSRQIEQTEAEAETLQVGKKKKATGDRLGELDQLNERRQWHIGRLEIVQRMLENGQLQVEQVETIQEDVKYFVEANAEEDFDFDDAMYDELNLQDEEDYLQEYAHADADQISNLDSASLVDPADTTPPIPAPAPKTPARDEDKATPAKKSTPASKPSAEETPGSPVSTKKGLASRKGTMESGTPKPDMTPSNNKAPSRSVSQSEATTAPAPAPAPTTPAAPAAVKAAVLPPIRYAAAAAAAVASAAAQAVGATTEPQGSPAKSKVEPAPERQATAESTEEKPVEPGSVVPVASPAPEAEPPAPWSNGHATAAPPPPPGLSRSPAPITSTSQSQPTPSQPPPPALSPQPQASLPPPGYPPAESSRTGSAVSQQAQGQAHPPGVLGNLMASFDVAKEMSERRAGDLGELNAALEGSYRNAPHQIDGEPPRYYLPKNPIKTPAYYPQSRPPVLEDKSIYSRLELDQLFYIFYYMTGTYEQWLAARELKTQSWRFHKQYLTWFQRAHNPQAITEDYEQGGYFYFDWENSWCQRKKSDFRFEYRWLSDH